MVKYCPFCGTPLKETNWKRLFCPNCGIIEEDKNNRIEDDGETTYTK